MSNFLNTKWLGGRGSNFYIPLVNCIFDWLIDILSKPAEMSSAEAIAGTEASERLIAPDKVSEEIDAHIGRVMLQRLRYSTSTTVSGTTLIPIDGTVPQNTEGTSWVNLSTFTPLSATSTIDVKIYATGTGDTGARNFILALFRDNIADALGANMVKCEGNTYEQFNFLHVQYKPLNTTPIDFKVRFGSDTAGTCQCPGRSGVWGLWAITVEELEI